MLAKVENGVLRAMCLGAGGPKHSTYTGELETCDAWKSGHHGAIDEPPDFGQIARVHYAEDALMKHPNGAPMFAPDGMMLDENGNRSVFDDVDQ
jgi:hypothetical protein